MDFIRLDETDTVVTATRALEVGVPIEASSTRAPAAIRSSCEAFNRARKVLAGASGATWQSSMIRPGGPRSPA